MLYLNKPGGRDTADRLYINERYKMGMLQTIGTGYEPMRPSDVTVADTAIDGQTAGYTNSFNDKSSYAKKLGAEYNGIELFFTGGWDFVVKGLNTNDSDGSAEQGCAFALYGYAENGPAMKICDGSIHLGDAYLDSTAASLDATHGMFCSSITVATETHLTSVTIADVDSTRGVAKLAIDTVGYSFLHIEYPDISFGVQAWIRPF